MGNLSLSCSKNSIRHPCSPKQRGAARYRVVLLDPQDARNVGMAARVCANYDAADLWVVSARWPGAGRRSWT